MRRTLNGAIDSQARTTAAKRCFPSPLIQYPAHRAPDRLISYQVKKLARQSEGKPVCPAYETASVARAVLLPISSLRKMWWR